MDPIIVPSPVNERPALSVLPCLRPATVGSSIPPTIPEDPIQPQLSNAIASSSTLPLEAVPNLPRPLRSCLSPSRRPSICPTPERVPSSRATSFSSDASFENGWRRTKSVRWEGEDQGCAVTSYHSTWSSLEYDRSPLEPPSEAERTCVLPERDSRCLRTKIDCFTSSAILDEFCESPVDERDASRDLIITPLFAEDVSIEDCSSTDVSDTEDREDEEDREWEACMERRRMMFAMRAQELKSEEHQPEFEGYRSLSATLAELLKSVGASDDVAMGPSGGPSVHVLSMQNLEDQEDGSVAEAPTNNLVLLSHPIMPTPSLLSSAGSEDDSVIVTSPSQPTAAQIILAPLSFDADKQAVDPADKALFIASCMVVQDGIMTVAAPSAEL
ncbi:hypothetical protein BD324DRAFT_652398 [Kockovaella imperatae]|uniref:Uncharacterized protein n=1 Tax=Kockovaella imperatae TaxID=4999 RepID=A0A1Y1UB66_9TREE|nr:hypothetical protein BD324DRAFT_652398 [Kockovaella imperatae]ORX35259.1 hypothetical protein BD324DRAFT_652398 [Kockovaella imperatae]